MSANPPTTRAEFASRLEHYAVLVRAMRGVSHTNPHAFHEDKSELVAAMTAEAREMRTIAPAAPRAAPQVASISPGVRTIGRTRRTVTVVSRQRRP